MQDSELRFMEADFPQSVGDLLPWEAGFPFLAKFVRHAVNFKALLIKNIYMSLQKKKI